MSLAERRKAKALEEAVPAQAVKLNGRSTRGQRISDLQGEDAEADETFWGQGAWQEADDSEFSTEEEEPDKFDDDFNESESEDEDDGKEETSLRKIERAAKRKRPAGGVYKEPKRFTGAKAKKPVSTPGENAVGGTGSVAGSSSRTARDQQYAPIQRSVRASTKTKTEKSFKEREGEARKAREEFLKRTKTQPKKLKGQFTQEQLLLEAIQTEQENMRWILKQQRLEDEAKEDEGRPKSHKALASRWMSRRGCLDSILFPSTLPDVLLQPPARLGSDTSAPDMDATGPSKGDSSTAESGGRKRSVRCKVTGRPAKYRDPLTGFPYADAAAFKELRRQYNAEKADQEGEQERDTKGADSKGSGTAAGAGAEGGTTTASASAGAGAGAATGAAGVAAAPGSAGPAKAAAAGGGQGGNGQNGGQSKKQGGSKDTEKKTKTPSGKGKGKASKKDPSKSSPAAMAKAEASKAGESIASGGATGNEILAANGDGGAAAPGALAPAKTLERKNALVKAEAKEPKGTKRRKPSGGAKGPKPTKKPFFASTPAPAPGSAPVAVSSTAAAASSLVASGPEVGLELVPLKAPTAAVAYRENGSPTGQHQQAVSTASASGRVASIAPVGGVHQAQIATATPGAVSAVAPPASGRLPNSKLSPLPRQLPTTAAAVPTGTTSGINGRNAAVGSAPTAMDIDRRSDEVAKGWEGALQSATAPSVYMGWQQPAAAPAAPAADASKPSTPG